jgi:N5-(cytidine 5'-diphosphoramidyl)-L-glutamine hydrolase
MVSKVRVGISLRVVKAQKYPELRDAISHEWIPFLEKIGVLPILIPNTLDDVSSYLNLMDLNGLILSGGDDMGDYPIRDKTEKKIIEFGIKSNIPIFGVCRGMQILNNYFHGSTTKNSGHVGNSHNVQITTQKFLQLLKIDLIKVNSFHNNTISQSTLGKELEPFAIFDKDDTIEGFIHKKYPIIGVMWHPERDQNLINTLMLKDFFMDPD